MDTQLKAEVEALYMNLGTSFSEAVRIFAQQTLREGGMPFTPSLKTWDELSQEEIGAKMKKSITSHKKGDVLTQEALDKKMKARFHRG